MRKKMVAMRKTKALYLVEKAVGANKIWLT